MSWIGDDIVIIDCDIDVTEEYALNICGKGYGHTKYENGRGYLSDYDEFVIDIEEVHAFLIDDTSST